MFFYLSQIKGCILNSWQAIIQFILLADASEAVPNLTKQSSYADYHLTVHNWDHLVSIRDALRVSLFRLRFSSYSLQLGASWCTAKLLMWTHAHSVANYTQFQVSDQVLGDYVFGSSGMLCLTWAWWLWLRCLAHWRCSFCLRYSVRALELWV